MRERCRWFLGSALICLTGLSWAPPVRAQTQGGAASSSGIGFIPQTSSAGSTLGQAGVVAVPSFTGAGGQQGVGPGTANSMAMDPLGLGYVYGAAIPMTRAQTGLFMLSMQQRMLGLGNGQLSGVRTAGQPESRSARTAGSPGAHPTAAHTRNANIPGGQAAHYFNRGTMSASRSQPYYNRQMRYFPQTAQ